MRFSHLYNPTSGMLVLACIACACIFLAGVAHPRCVKTLHFVNLQLTIYITGFDAQHTRSPTKETKQRMVLCLRPSHCHCSELTGLLSFIKKARKFCKIDAINCLKLYYLKIILKITKASFLKRQI